MIVVGTDRDDMARAANILRKVGGGAVVVSRGETLALCRTPHRRPHVRRARRGVAKKADQLVAAMKACGCTLNNAYMQHSLLALVVIPELRISDVGLVDVRTFEKVELFV